MKLTRSFRFSARNASSFLLLSRWRCSCQDPRVPFTGRKPFSLQEAFRPLQRCPTTLEAQCRTRFLEHLRATKSTPARWHTKTAAAQRTSPSILTRTHSRKTYETRKQIRKVSKSKHVCRNTDTTTRTAPRPPAPPAPPRCQGPAVDSLAARM